MNLLILTGKNGSVAINLDRVVLLDFVPDDSGGSEILVLTGLNELHKKCTVTEAPAQICEQLVRMAHPVGYIEPTSRTGSICSKCRGAIGEKLDGSIYCMDCGAIFLPTS